MLTVILKTLFVGHDVVRHSSLMNGAPPIDLQRHEECTHTGVNIPAGSNLTDQK